MAALMWVVEIVDQVADGRLDAYGIEPREVDGLDGIVFAPFLHGGLDHLIGNTIPFLLLGFAIALGGIARRGDRHRDRRARRRARDVARRARRTRSTSARAASSSASPPTSSRAASTAAASGRSRSALVVLAVWGTTLLRGLVPEDGISWQGHLFGAIGGVLAARLLHRRAERAGTEGPPALSRI